MVRLCCCWSVFAGRPICWLPGQRPELPYTHSVVKPFIFRKNRWLSTFFYISLELNHFGAIAEIFRDWALETLTGGA